MRAITFNELRKIKDSLPDGSMHRIADELGLNVDTVRNFFGGQNFKEGKSVGIHLEPGPDGGRRYPRDREPPARGELRRVRERPGLPRHPRTGARDAEEVLKGEGEP